MDELERASTICLLLAVMYLKRLSELFVNFVIKAKLRYLLIITTTGKDTVHGNIHFRSTLIKAILLCVISGVSF